MQLPVYEIISQACHDTWNNRRELTSVAFVPVLAVAVAGTIITAFNGDPRILLDNSEKLQTSLAVKLILGGVLNWLIGLVFYTLFAVAWCRRTLVSSETITVGAAMNWNRRHWSFFLKLILLIINLFGLFLLMSILLSTILPIAPILSALFIICGLIYARAALIFPAVATDALMTVGDSIKLTNGNSWRMCIAVAVIPFLIMLLGSVIVLMLATTFSAFIGSSVTAQFLLSIAVQSINYFGFAIGITALSLAYRQLNI